MMNQNAIHSSLVIHHSSFRSTCSVPCGDNEGTRPRRVRRSTDMPARLLGSLLLLVVVRCTAAEPAPTPAVQRWQMGQEALRNGNVDEAIELYRQSLQLD